MEHLNRKESGRRQSGDVAGAFSAGSLLSPSPCKPPEWVFKNTDLIVFVPSEDQGPQRACSLLYDPSPNTTLSSHIKLPTIPWAYPSCLCTLLVTEMHPDAPASFRTQVREVFSRAFPVTSNRVNCQKNRTHSSAVLSRILNTVLWCKPRLSNFFEFLFFGLREHSWT